MTTTKEEDIRTLVAQLRDAYENEDNEALRETLESLETVVAELKAGDESPVEPPPETLPEDTPADDEGVA